MNILILSWHFAPANTIGAVRVSKLAGFLQEHDHEVRVVTARNPAVHQSLPVLSSANVHAAKSPDINALPKLAQQLRLSWTGRGGHSGQAAPLEAPGDNLLRQAAIAYMAVTNIPDRHIGWLPFGLMGIWRLTRRWKPDLIYASGPPFTPMVAASWASRCLGIPWLAELRDRWADDPYMEIGAFRRRFMDRIERRVLGTAAGLVTVSEPWTAFYRGKYDYPVVTVLNGYDPKDLAGVTEEPKPDPSRLHILHAGTIYLGRRDPSPLFEAIAKLGVLKDRVRVHFYGAYVDHLRLLAERHGVAGQIELKQAVAYTRSLQLQRQSDVLLLLQWNDPREQGNCPAKLFEYLGALRPVLGIGLEEGVPAQIIRSRDAGFFSNDPSAIAQQLRTWIDDKVRSGRTLELPECCRVGLTREAQFEKLLPFIREAVARGRGPGTNVLAHS